MFLTFDDGPLPEVTEFVLDELKKFNASATFFCVGSNVVKHPGIYKRILDEKHNVGNHTFNHKNGWHFSTGEYIEDVKKAEAVISSTLFRPPYGRIKKTQSELILNDYKIIMWDVLSYDFDQNITPEKCLRNVMENSRQGSVIVFHDSMKASPNMMYALPRMLEHFTNKGYTFSPII